MHFPECNLDSTKENYNLDPSLSIHFKKNSPLHPCVACNVVKTLKRGANKNWGILRLIIRAVSGDSSY